MTTGDITSRDLYVLAQALAYGIAITDCFPEEHQEKSNRADMLKLLERFVPDPRQRQELMREVRERMARIPSGLRAR